MDSIVVAYDNDDHATQAIAALLRAGVPEASVHRHIRDGDTMTTDSHPVLYAKPTSIWNALLPFGDAEELPTYEVPAEAEGSVVRVSMIPQPHYDAVMNILASYHPVEVRAHSAE